MEVGADVSHIIVLPLYEISPSALLITIHSTRRDKPTEQKGERVQGYILSAVT